MSLATIDRLYTALSERDGDAMADCYHARATFSDPVFVDLRGDEVGAMLRMLCAQGDDLAVTWSDMWSEGATGGARWEATYSFGPRGRSVHNRIEARFTFADELILTHVDRFDLWRWSRMALGPVGTALGWSPIVRNHVRARAESGLRRWTENGSS